MWYPASSTMSGYVGIASSHRAPRNIAPIPVCQKYFPDKIELRHGVQLGAGTFAFRKRAPSFAILSKLGVLISSWMLFSPG